jgi:predicted NUDIX family NTP pyrophosphohydrolase
LPCGPFVQLTPRKQLSGKVIHIWAAEADWNPMALVSNSFRMEWPRGSGRMQEFPEVDRAEWFKIQDALGKIQPGQVAFVEEQAEKLSSPG